MEILDNSVEYKKIFLLFNTESGKTVFTNNAERIKKLLSLLRKIFFSTEIIFAATDTFNDIKIQTQLACNLNVDLIIVAGGDGTLRAVTDIVEKNIHKPIIATFPAGTVNLIAHELTMPDDVTKWLHRLKVGKTKNIWAARANGNIFLAVAGVGLDSYIVSNVTSQEKKALGKAAYIVKATTLLKTEWNNRFNITIDGEEITEAFASVIIMRGKYYAGTYKLLEQADLSDEYMNVCTLSTAYVTDIMKYALLLVRGTLSKDPAMKIYRAKEVIIKYNNYTGKDKGFPVQLDGDCITCVPVEITLCDEPLKFLS